MTMRLQKFLAHSGICSRRKAEKYIQQGRIKVNDKIVVELGTKIVPGEDKILFDNNQIFLNLEKENIYIALNKPVGFISSCSRSHKKEKIVLDLVDIKERIYPVGRLDKDSEGLILLTDDGALHNKLSHPSFDHEKEYEVSTGIPISGGALKKLEKGMMLRGTKTRPAKIRRLSPQRFCITLQEGKNRQIRRMVRKVGGHVTGLKRLRMANIRLGRLPEGGWRYLSENERERLLKSVLK